MTPLTEVELYFLKGKIERWIRFGAPLNERTLDRRRRVAYFAPGINFRIRPLGVKRLWDACFAHRYSARM